MNVASISLVDDYVELLRNPPASLSFLGSRLDRVEYVGDA
jgi:hypothetical protein